MEFDEIFLDFARMGRCIFTESIPTACISMGKDGREMGFFWNPTFFDKCSDYKNAFILCHEMLHVFLKHGKRGKNLENHDKANVAMDISINHLLVDGFGFTRSMIEDWKKLCWRDTVFNTHVDPQPSFEGYYNIEDKFFNEGFQSLDLHKFMEEEANLPPNLEKVMDKITERMMQIPGFSGEECEFLESMVQPVISRKPKFEIVVRNLSRSIMKKTKVFADTFGKIDRRLYDVAPGIPVRERLRDRKKKDKYLCHFYIDNSGSCQDYIQRFANCANSLNEKVFEVRVFTFDTRVYEVNKQNGNYVIRGGGSTAFGPVVRHAQSAPRHPDVCFVLTDGIAESVTTKKPRQWHWLITPNGSTRSLIGAGKTWPLSQFE